jgi:hypothetical protein
VQGSMTIIIRPFRLRDCISMCLHSGAMACSAGCTSLLIVSVCITAVLIQLMVVEHFSPAAVSQL